MSNQKVFKINDKAYLINAFRGFEGWSYLPRLTKYVFPFISFFGEGEKSVTDDAIISQMMDILTGENAKEVERIVIDMVSNVQIDGSKIDFDREFTQKYDELLLLFVEVVKLNYLDSFQRLVTNLPNA